MAFNEKLVHIMFVISIYMLTVDSQTTIPATGDRVNPSVGQERPVSESVPIQWCDVNSTYVHYDIRVEQRNVCLCKSYTSTTKTEYTLTAWYCGDVEDGDDLCLAANVQDDAPIVTCNCRESVTNSTCHCTKPNPQADPHVRTIPCLAPFPNRLAYGCGTQCWKSNQLSDREINVCICQGSSSIPIPAAQRCNTCSSKFCPKRHINVNCGTAADTKMVHMFAIPELPGILASGNTPWLLINLNTLSSSQVNVHIQNSGICYEFQTLTVVADDANIKIDLTEERMIPERSNTFVITSCGKISVYVAFMSGTSILAGFTVLPTSELGFAHSIVSYQSEEQYVSAFSVAALEERTKVIIKYLNSDVEQVLFLGPYESYRVVRARFDLTGTIIEASTPVAVLSGGLYRVQTTTPFTNPTTNQFNVLLEQMPPFRKWGHQFVLALPATPTIEYFEYRILCRNPGTPIEIVDAMGNSMQRRCNSVGFYEEKAPDVTFIIAEEPVLVVQIIPNPGLSMIVSTPVEFYGSDVIFPVFRSENAFITILINCEWGRKIIVDRVSVYTVEDSGVWDFSESTGHDGVEICIIKGSMEPGAHTVSHPNSETSFAVNVYQTGSGGSFAYHAVGRDIPIQENGVCLSQPCRNGGTCNEVDTDTNVCTCPSGFTGTMCEDTALNACSSEPCYNDGICRVEDNLYTCYCSAEYTGTQCELDSSSGGTEESSGVLIAGVSGAVSVLIVLIIIIAVVLCCRRLFAKRQRAKSQSNVGLTDMSRPVGIERSNDTNAGAFSNQTYGDGKQQPNRVVSGSKADVYQDLSGDQRNRIPVYQGLKSNTQNQISSSSRDDDQDEDYNYIDPNPSLNRNDNEYTYVDNLQISPIRDDNEYSYADGRQVGRVPARKDNTYTYADGPSVLPRGGQTTAVTNDPEYLELENSNPPQLYTIPTAPADPEYFKLESSNPSNAPPEDKAANAVYSQLEADNNLRVVADDTNNNSEYDSAKHVDIVVPKDGRLKENSEESYQHLQGAKISYAGGEEEYQHLHREVL